jgi:hypothetical protein
MGSRQKKRWRIERWEAEVLPRLSVILEEHLKLSLRDSTILTTALLDLGLADLINKRLAGPEHEIVEFLGADEDGRAPCGSFGSRIQLARLIGIISDEDARLLRQLKALRNTLAHRVDGTSERVVKELVKVWDSFSDTAFSMSYFVDKLLAGDERAYSLVSEDPDWKKHQAAIDTVRERMAQFKEHLIEQGINVRDLPPVTGMFLVLKNTIKFAPGQAGVVVTGLILAVYNTLFEHLLIEMTPIQEMKLTALGIVFGPSPAGRRARKAK